MQVAVESLRRFDANPFFKMRSNSVCMYACASVLHQAWAVPKAFSASSVPVIPTAVMTSASAALSAGLLPAIASFLAQREEAAQQEGYPLAGVCMAILKMLTSALASPSVRPPCRNFSLKVSIHLLSVHSAALPPPVYASPADNHSRKI